MKSIATTRQLPMGKITRRTTAYRMPAILLIGGGLLWAISTALSPAHAQGVYRIVGPDGKVTFSDQPPREPSRATPVTPGAPAASTAGGAGASAGSGAGPQIPYEVRQIAGRFPVVLYSQPDGCSGCNAARIFLNARGIPFVEKTVITEEDGKELARLFNASSVPALTIGRQQLVGFSDTEWTQYLDAAGYPKTSQLPSGYRNGPKSPLVAATPVAAPSNAPVNTSTGLTPLPALTAPTAPTPNNPAGISF